MLQIKNPYFKPLAEVNADKHAAALDTWLKARPERELIGLDEIRAALPAGARAEVTREVFNIITEKLGIAIVNPDDREGLAEEAAP